MKSVSFVFSVSRHRAIVAVATFTLAFLLLPWTAFAQPEPVGISIDIVLRAFQGNYVYVGVNLENPNPSLEIEGFNLVVEYDASALTFMEAEAGILLQNCGWESLTYSPAAYGVRISAEADVTDIPGSPNCFLEGETGSLLGLVFYVTDDVTYDCTFIPIKFRWDDCEDNYLMLKDVDDYVVSDSVFIFESPAGFSLIPVGNDLPSYGGAPDSCLNEFPDGAGVTRLADFYGGGVDIICSDSADFRGDLNLNSIPYEIADFIVYENYLLYGLSAFEINTEVQISASDINNDGVFLTYRDFVYLWRIIIGDANPYPGGDKAATHAVTFFQHGSDSISILDSEVPLAGVYLIFNGNIIPTLVPSAFPLAYSYDGSLDETRVVIEPVDRETTIGNGPLLTFEGSGTLQQAYTADYEDSHFDVTISIEGFEISVDYVMDLLQYIFAGGPYPSPTEFADADCSGAVDIDDVVYIIAYLFSGGPPPGGC